MVEKIFLFHIILLVLVGFLVILIKGWRSTKQYIKLLFSKKEMPKKIEPDSNGYETRPVREPEHWSRIRPLAELQEIRLNIIKELMKMKNTDWGTYALRFICNHSPKLANMMVNGEVHLELIQNEEMQGIKDTIDIIQRVELKDNTSLRNYFQEIFEAISLNFIYDTNRKFCYYGRDRVVDMLRMYNASEGGFAHYDKKQKYPFGLELTAETSIDNEVVKKIQKALDLSEKTDVRTSNMEEIREHFRQPLNSSSPYLEFDLDAIAKIDNFKYQGSLVNALHSELKRLLQVSLENEAAEYYASSDPLWDYVRFHYPIDDGCIVLTKVKGAVDYYPDRLFVEFVNLPRDHWTYKWLKSYKMFLEGND